MKGIVALIHFTVAALVAFELFGAGWTRGDLKFKITDSTISGSVLTLHSDGTLELGHGYTLKEVLEKAREIAFGQLCQPHDRKWKNEITNLHDRHLRCYEI